MAISDIRKANKAFESWLKSELNGDLVVRDLPEKWEKMSKNAFSFLRATYWRWAETIYDVCPELKTAPKVLGVGDIHLENFGTWRDADGRLVWGVNDFDEAAKMPYVLDLVRLATSAILARPSRALGRKKICAAIREGYAKGLKHPAPIVLDENRMWLRTLLAVPEREREQFWEKMNALKPKKPRHGYRKAIEASMPDRTVEIQKFSPRAAGTGSLGRPRWVGIAQWRGGQVVREAKALVPSAWTRVSGRGLPAFRSVDIAGGRYRAPDPWWQVTGKIVVRRLSPNSRKIEVEDFPDELLNARMLGTMGSSLPICISGSETGARRSYGTSPRATPAG